MDAIAITWKHVGQVDCHPFRATEFQTIYNLHYRNSSIAHSFSCSLLQKNYLYKALRIGNEAVAQWRF